MCSKPFVCHNSILISIAGGIIIIPISQIKQLRLIEVRILFQVYTVNKFELKLILLCSYTVMLCGLLVLCDGRRKGSNSGKQLIMKIMKVSYSVWAVITPYYRLLANE